LVKRMASGKNAVGAITSSLVRVYIKSTKPICLEASLSNNELTDISMSISR
jgi:hypothetical protein